MKVIDPHSPVPLYHQIAEAIREKIEAGELAPGDALEPLREAAQTWGVNLHTVRHAYTALAREGLVESRGARGTRVAAGPPAGERPAAENVAVFVERVVGEARRRHGLDAHSLVREIQRLREPAGDDRPVAYVVECSAWQCEAHAREIAGRFDVDAREWSLERNEEPPSGTIIATYFHYNDIRRLWPHRLREVRFVTIVPDPAIAESLDDGIHTVMVCERDEATAENVAADLSSALAPSHIRITPIVSDAPESLLPEASENAVIFVSPRIWATLPAPLRSNPLIREVAYVIDTNELDSVGAEQGWLARATPSAARTTE